MLHVGDPGGWGRRIQSHDVRATPIEQIRAAQHRISFPVSLLLRSALNATPPYTGAVEGLLQYRRNSNREQSQARVMLVSQHYFAALHIPLVQRPHLGNADENLAAI